MNRITNQIEAVLGSAEETALLRETRRDAARAAGILVRSPGWVDIHVDEYALLGASGIVVRQVVLCVQDAPVVVLEVKQ